MEIKVIRAADEQSKPSGVCWMYVDDFPTEGPSHTPNDKSNEREDESHTRKEAE